MQLDFWRALGITTGVFIAYSVAGYAIDPTAKYATVSANGILMLASAAILAVFSFAYFSTPALKPSARHGLELAAFMFLVFLAMGIAGEVIAPVPYEPIPYEAFFWIAGIVIGLGTPTLVGWYMDRNK